MSAPGLVCPLPVRRHERVLLGHGGGGRLTRELIEGVFLPAFDNAPLRERHDGATVSCAREGGPRLAFTTDAYVVRPIFFPGGDLGTLAVNGTVNDLAMCGAWPRWLSAAFIIEEGLPMSDLERVAASMRQAALVAGVQVVTGDTKVVDKGKGDGLFVTTAGVGVVLAASPPSPRRVQPGDAILLSGDVGRHGVAVLAARESLGFETTLESDCAPLHGPVLELLQAGFDVHCLRDLTRGGLGAALCEIAEGAACLLSLDEARVPVRDDVAAACELLGLDPLYVANEGRFVAFVPRAQADGALDLLRRHAVSAQACLIGEVRTGESVVTLRTRLGSTRLVDLPSGEQLPRIC